MYKLCIFFIALYLMSCKSPQKQQSSSTKDIQSSENFDWLLGNWERTNEKESRRTLENWLKTDSLQYVGFGVTLEGNDTIWQENIVLEKSDEKWVFKVTGKGDREATEFVLKSRSHNMFICENEQNEFPKKIMYARENNKLNAVISGGDVEIPFEFEMYK